MVEGNTHMDSIDENLQNINKTLENHLSKNNEITEKILKAMENLNIDLSRH